MRFVASQSLKPLKNRPIDSSGTKLVDQLVVVNCGLFSIGRNRSLYVPGCNHLTMSFGMCGFDRWWIVGRR